MENFEQQLQQYVQDVQTASDSYFKEHLKSLYGTKLQPKFEAVKGKHWIKIIKKDAAQTSSFCFVDSETGDLYKADTWSKPGIGIRGNIAAKSAVRPLRGMDFYKNKT